MVVDDGCLSHEHESKCLRSRQSLPLVPLSDSKHLGVQTCAKSAGQRLFVSGTTTTTTAKATTLKATAATSEATTGATTRTKQEVTTPTATLIIAKPVS